MATEIPSEDIDPAEAEEDLVDLEPEVYDWEEWHDDVNASLEGLHATQQVLWQKLQPIEFYVELIKACILGALIGFVIGKLLLFLFD